MYKKMNAVFYQNIAKLFYAIAAADHAIREEEFAALQLMVKQEWLAIEKSEDEFNTDAAYQIEFVFEWLQLKKLDAYDCFNAFIAYKNEHPYFFTEDLNQLILKTAEKIATSFSGKNKSELIMLAKLNLHLKNNAI